MVAALASQQHSCRCLSQSTSERARRNCLTSSSAHQPRADFLSVLIAQLHHAISSRIPRPNRAQLMHRDPSVRSRQSPSGRSTGSPSWHRRCPWLCPPIESWSSHRFRRQVAGSAASVASTAASPFPSLRDRVLPIRHNSVCSSISSRGPLFRADAPCTNVAPLSEMSHRPSPRVTAHDVRRVHRSSETPREIPLGEVQSPGTRP